jgi:hypothetical protein
MGPGDDFIAPTECGEEFDALVDLICAEAAEAAKAAEAAEAAEAGAARDCGAEPAPSTPPRAGPCSADLTDSTDSTPSRKEATRMAPRVPSKLALLIRRALRSSLVARTPRAHAPLAKRGLRLWPAFVLNVGGGVR